MAREARSPGDRCTLSSPLETQRRQLWILGGGDQLRAGTMFLATLYFALPLLGKSRPLLAFFFTQSLSKRVPCSGHSRIAPWVPWIWVGEVSLGCEEVQAFLGLGSGGSAALCGWFYFAVLIITQPDGHLMGSRPSPRCVGPLGSREELAKALRQVECGRKNAGVGREQTWNAKVFWE